MMNNTLLCSFPSINQVLTSAETGALNITQIVEACPDVCSLAWGIGNPDLSGIGAYISYILQVVLAIVFGPIFVTTYGFRKRLNISADAQQYWVDLQSTFLDVSAQFSIPVTIAAVVRLHQGPPFFEISFLLSLATMQFLCLLSTAIAAGVGMPKHRDMRRILVISLYLLVDFGFFMGVIGYLRRSKASWTTIQDLANQCRGYSNISPGFIYVQSHDLHLSHLTASQYWGRKGYIISGLIIAGIVALILAWFILVCLYYLLKARHPVIMGPMSAAFCIGVLVCMVQLQKKREWMREITGNVFVDNEWGFGQVIAIFLWAPLVIQSVYYVTISTCSSLKPTAQADLTRSYHRCKSCYTCEELDRNTSARGKSNTTADIEHGTIGTTAGAMAGDCTDVEKGHDIENAGETAVVVLSSEDNK